jgi:hypothetical protein
MAYKNKAKQREYQRLWSYNKSRKLGVPIRKFGARSVIEQSRMTREKRREAIRKLKSKPCMDCGVQYPYYVMDFDHKGDKVAKVSFLSKGAPMEVVLKEIAKCDLVCANCHRIRTYS